MIFLWVFMMLVLYLRWRWARCSPLHIAQDAFLVTTQSDQRSKHISRVHEVLSDNVLYRLNLTHASEDTRVSTAHIPLSTTPNNTQHLVGNASQDGLAALTLRIDGRTFAKAERHTYIRESYS